MRKALFSQCPLSDKDIKTLLEQAIEIKSVAGGLPEDELIQELQGCSFYIIGGADKASKKVIESTNLELIIFFGTGYESHVDIDTANQKGIPVANTPKANAYTVAEHTAALILDAVKQITYLNNTTKRGKWLRRQTWNLEGKTLGIVGLGTIGGNVARIMHNAFKMKIVYTSRNRKEGLENELDAIKVGLDDLMSTADVISIHASYSNETLNLIGEKELSKTQPHTVLVCTSRAELVNPKALKEALDNNKLAVAAFDAYYREPVPSREDDEWGLLSLADNKFIITPHTAYGSKEAVENMNAMVVENITSFIQTGKPKYLVNLGK